MKIFGIGWAKTGTTTLGRCLELLGYRHVGQRLDLVPHLEKGDLAAIHEVAAEADCTLVGWLRPDRWRRFT